MTRFGEWASKVYQFRILISASPKSPLPQNSFSPLYSVSVLQETCEHPVLSCPVFYIFVPYTLHDYPKISQGLLFISIYILHSAFCSTWSVMVLSRIFLNRNLRLKVWHLSYTETFERNSGKKKKEPHSQQIHFSRSPLCSWKQF